MWDAFKDLIFWGMSACYNFVGDWGLAIVVATIIFRVLLVPLMQKQIRSSYQMRKVQPLMQEIQTKYANDQRRMQEEMQKLYKEAGFNPIAGCVPMLLQMPIFVAMFQVLQEMSWRTGSNEYNFFNLVPSLVTTPSGAFESGFGEFIPYLILLLVFAFATFIPMIIQQWGQKGSQAQQTLIMAVVMSGMMLFIGWGSPAGVLLFWGTSSIFALVQQLVVQRIMKHEDEIKEEEIVEVKPVQVEVTRKVKKKRPTKNKK